MEISSISTEYVTVPFSATPHDPTSDPVYMAFKPANATPGGGDWNTATWLSGASTPTAICLVGPANSGIVLAKGTYICWVKVTDNPEIPGKPAPGQLVIY